MKQSVVIILTLQSYCFFPVPAIVVRDSEQGCPGFCIFSALRIIKTRGVTRVTAVTGGCGFVASGGKKIQVARVGFCMGYLVTPVTAVTPRVFVFLGLDIYSRLIIYILLIYYPYIQKHSG